MSVLLELALDTSAFELGRILPDAGEFDYSLETIVPLGESAVQFVRVYDGSVDEFEAAVRPHPNVQDLTIQTEPDGAAIYRIEWDLSGDEFISAIQSLDGHIVSAKSRGGRWLFTIQFPNPELVSALQDRLERAEIHTDVVSVKNPWDPDAPLNDAVDALSAPQREALYRAVDAGYYDIPRRISTSDLAEQFDISDQALSERLRRGIAALVRETRGR